MSQAPEKIQAPFCSYCGNKSELVDSERVYGRSYGMMYLCANYPVCDAYVGCHPGTDKPLGRLANAELREWKKKAHAAFDPLWRNRVQGRQQMKRSEAYAWLAKELGLERERTHIGMFDVLQCKQVVELCMNTRFLGPTATGLHTVF